jgi:N-acetylglucosaminyldiphosphoundecaprenol N-acetyl-beta-D-mannosaminyltransferase
MDDLMADIDCALTTQLGLTITFANPNYLMAAVNDPDLRRRINAFDHVLTDGWGVMLAARILGERIPMRLANDDIVEPLFELLARRRAKVFLLGSAPGVAETARGRLVDNLPGLSVVGSFHGFLDVHEGTPGHYSDAAFSRMVDEVNATKPDFLVVGIPTPNQQRFVIDHLSKLDVPVIMTGGSWIDHLAERIEFYPPLVTRLNLCWAYRWVREPRRLAHRYTAELADFGRQVVRQRLGLWATFEGDREHPPRYARDQSREYAEARAIWSSVGRTPV